MAYGFIFSNEIWLLVMKMLDPSSLKTLTRVSQNLHSLAIAVLYSTIDLSIHHDNPETQCSVETQRIFGQQALFMQQVLDRPELALQVRAFTWTMGLEQLCHLPEWASRTGESPPPIYNLENIYVVFSYLRQVLHVDIHGGDFHNYPCPAISNLFPDASYIRLSGQMHYALASAILHGSNKVPLHSLTLCILLERGRFQTGHNYEPQFDPRLRRTRRALPLEEIWPQNVVVPTQVAPGEMVRLLLDPTLQSRCAHLQNFTFGVLDLTREYRWSMLPPGWCVRILSIHEELTEFFQTVHPHNVEITYSQLSPERRQELRSLYWRPHCRVHPRPSAQPQHALFHILREGWPELESLIIRGGQRSSDFHRPPELLPSPVGHPNLDGVQVLFEPDRWVSFHGRLCTSQPNDQVNPQ